MGCRHQLCPLQHPRYGGLCGARRCCTDTQPGPQVCWFVMPRWSQGQKLLANVSGMRGPRWAWGLGDSS